MDQKIKWGIVGLGKIANRFASDLVLVQEAELEAVASRDIDKAKSFSDRYNSNNYYGSYEELICDSFVEIVYIATPHNSHESLTLLALKHKKAVLCEKPLAINRSQVLKMVGASKSNHAFLMEALWSRFNPSIIAVKKRIEQGELGDIKYINADFSFKANLNIQRIYDLELGGGSLLDIGIYPVFLAYLLLGTPHKISADAHFFDSGADAQLAMVFSYENAQAVLFSSFKSNSKRMAKISGTSAEIIIDHPWNEATSYSVLKENDESVFSIPLEGKGFTYEIKECNTCLREGRIESTLWSHENSIALISLMDRIRKKIGLSYREDTR